jgi:hypothetical protein
VSKCSGWLQKTKILGSSAWKHQARTPATKEHDLNPDKYKLSFSRLLGLDAMQSLYLEMIAIFPDSRDENYDHNASNCASFGTS